MFKGKYVPGIKNLGIFGSEYRFNLKKNSFISGVGGKFFDFDDFTIFILLSRYLRYLYFSFKKLPRPRSRPENCSTKLILSLM